MCVQGPCQEEWRVSTREEARQEEHGLELMKLGRKHGLELMKLTRKEAKQAASS